MKTIPPLDDLFNLAGMNLPNYLKGENRQEIIPVEGSTEEESSEEIM
jgi:flotillin